MIPFGVRAQSESTKSLRIASAVALRQLDPFTTTSTSTRNHAYMVYDTLFAVDSQYRPQPQMVDHWTVSDDKLAYTFKLREGLAFHDGTPVTAADCIASISRWGRRDVSGIRLLASVKEMAAPDTKTFRIELKSPFGILIDSFAKPSTLPLFIMPKRLADTPIEKDITDPTGSGPFIFDRDSFVPGVRTVYLRNKAYVPRSEKADNLAGGKIVKVDRVECQFFPDFQTSVNALKKGEIDVIEYLNGDQKTLFDGASNLKLAQRQGANAPVMRFNWQQHPFSDVRMRRAVQLAVTQRDYMDAMIGDPKAYEICGALFGCGTQLASDRGVVGTGDANLDKAKALVKEAGYAGEKIVIFTVGDLPIYQGIAPLTQQILRSIGLNAEIQVMDYTTYLSRRNSQAPVSDGGWSVAFAIWQTVDLLNPISNLNVDARGKIAYAGWPDDPETERLKDQYVQAPGIDQQREIAATIQQRSYDQVYYIPLGTFFNYSAYLNNVTNYLSGAVPVYWSVEKA